MDERAKWYTSSDADSAFGGRPEPQVAVMQDSITISQRTANPAAKQESRTGAGRGPADLLDAVKDVTQRHFPERPVEVESDYDPGVPSDEFYVLSVMASGSVEEIAQRRRLWRREVDELAAEFFDSFRISVRVLA